MDPTRTIEVRGPSGPLEPMNLAFRDALWLTLGVAGFLVLLIRILEILWAQLRLVSAMSVPREKQGYWKTAQWGWMPAVKKHVTYAPLWNKRHNREIKLSSAINVGTLPSRLHAVVLLVYLSSNLAYMFVVNWSQQNKYALCAEIRGRSGTLALVNMVPLILFAGRNNPLISMLKISFDTYNLLHRWMGRLVVAESILHTIAWSIPAVASKGWDGIVKAIVNSPFLGSGFLGMVALMLLFIGALSPVRHAFYETFLNLHILLALIVFVCSWVHCASSDAPGGLPQLPWIMGIMGVWFADRFARILRLACTNWSKRGFTDAFCEAMPGDVTRVTLNLPRYMNIRPGTHAYLRFLGINAWETHPFSIAWVEHSMDHSLPLSEKEPLHLGLDKKQATTSVGFVIGAQTGFTRKLYEKACESKGGIRLRAAMEGPYAGHHNLDSYGHLVLFAGSTGITHQISYLRHHLEGYNNGSVATRRITLVWIIRSYESLEWVRPYMDAVLRIPNRIDILRIQVFVTRPLNPRDIVSSSSTVKMFPGRPNVPLLLMKEVQEQTGAMAVTVCGPGALADDVRAAVRGVQGDTVIDFIEESFTW